MRMFLLAFLFAHEGREGSQGLADSFDKIGFIFKQKGGISWIELQPRTGSLR